MDKAPFIDRLKEGLLSMGATSLSSEALEKLYSFQEILTKWNKTLNLTAHRKADSMIEKNFLDCLALSPHISLLKAVMDLGSGAGFPGIVVKIVKPEIKMTLVESDQRKASFLATVLRELVLLETEVSNIHLDKIKVEELGWQGKFDGVVSRATIPFPKILPLASLCLKKGGHFFGMVIGGKEKSNDEETPDKDMFRVEREIDYFLPFSRLNRKIKILQKI